MFKDELKEYVESSGLVNKKLAGDGIYVLKYKNKVFYDNLWNEYLEHCRGTIVDNNFELVSYPFPKIYNYGIEKSAPVLEDSTTVDAFRKVNGFMAAVTWHDGELLVSTTGTTDSDFVAMARELIDYDRYRSVCENHQRYTFMFECVHERDPHIIPETPGMYLLGFRQKSWKSEVDTRNLEILAKNFGCYTPEHYRITMKELKEMTRNCRHEGFVFYADDDISAKIKSPYYLTSKWVARNPRTDKIIDTKRDIKHNIDEEYHDLIDKIRENIVQYSEMNEQERLAWVREQLL